MLKRVFPFLFFCLTFRHKSSRRFCSFFFNLALGSQRDSYVATNSIIYYTVASFLINSKEERSQKDVRYDYVLTASSLNPFAGSAMCNESILNAST